MKKIRVLMLSLLSLAVTVAHNVASTINANILYQYIRYIRDYITWYGLAGGRPQMFFAYDKVNANIGFLSLSMFDVIPCFQQIKNSYKNLKVNFI